MGKTKQILVLVLAVVLLAVGGLLPFVTSAIQEKQQMGAVQYGDMTTLELELRSEEMESLDMFDKLLLLQTGEMLEWAETEGNEATHEELLALAEGALADYYDAGLLLWSAGEMEMLGYMPFFLYLPGNPEINTQMWLLEMNDPEGIQLGIVVDMESGKLVAMECTSSLYLEKLGYDYESYAAVLAEVYFSSLDLAPFAVEMPYYDSGISQHYYLEKEGYENVMVYLYIQPDGFCITPGAI